MSREQAETAWTGKEFLVWGGFAAGACRPTGYCQDGARYDPSTDRWATMTNEKAPSPRSLSSAIWTGGRLFVWGGRDADDNSLGDGGLYDPVTDSWSPIAAGGPSPRQQASVAWTGTRVLVWGGVNQRLRSFEYLRDGWSFDPETGAWTGMSDQGAPASRVYNAAVWTGAELLIWGGQSGDGSYAALGDGALYDPVGDRWRPVASPGALSPRWAVPIAWTDTRAVLWGGLDCGGGTACNDGAFYDPATNAWQPIDRRTSSRVFRLAWTGRFVLLWSGNPEPGWVLEPRTKNWLRMTAVPPDFDPRDGASIAWTGRELLIWGGALDDLPFGDGVAFTPPN